MAETLVECDQNPVSEVVTTAVQPCEERGGDELVGSGGGREFKAEIDTSAPFESVKEAVQPCEEKGASGGGRGFKAEIDTSVPFESVREAVQPCEERGGGKLVGSGGGRGFKAEIDTSAPFESVKEAVSRFGGLGYWKPSCHHHCDTKVFDSKFANSEEDIDITNVEEQAAELEKELIMKEKDTLEVLKELETTKMIVEELKLKLQNAGSATPTLVHSNPEGNKLTVSKRARQEEKENDPPGEMETDPNSLSGGLTSSVPSSTPGLILKELNQAKLNLTRTTGDLAEIRASVESYNKKIEKERKSLEKTRERLNSNTMKIASLEKEFNQTQLKLKLAEDCENGDGNNNISAEMHRLSCEAEKFKKVGEVAKKEVKRVMSEIEQTNAKIKTTDIRLIAARKMKEAARAAEAVALAEIKALDKSNECSSLSESSGDAVTLTYEEYSSLTYKAREADDNCKKRVAEALEFVGQANSCKSDILKKVEEAMEEVKTSQKALEEALRRVEAANQGKLAVEEALRRWREDHGQKRRSSSVIHSSSTKFKVSGPTTANLRKDSPRLLDVNGLELVPGDDAAAAAGTPVLQSTLSIGQILSRKLLVAEEYNLSRKSCSGKRKVSLAQMLGKQSGELSSSWKIEKERGGVGSGSSSIVRSGSARRQQQLPVKRKKFGFVKLSKLLSTKQNQKKKMKKPSSATAFHEYPSLMVA